MTKKQKVSLVVSLFMLFALPVSVFLALGPVNLLPRASNPATTPTIPIVTPSLPSCNQNYLMTWRDDQGKITRQDPYILKDDTCTGLRCLISNEISPSCYNQDQCATACSGQCVNINQWRVACGLITIPTIPPYSPTCAEDILCARGYVPCTGPNGCPSCCLDKPTPTPTRVPTATPTPTKAPVPTFIPTPTVTSTPVPTLNINPVIQTTSLPSGKWLTDYKSSVIGYDYNVRDILTMKVTGLPFGLRQAPCNTSKLADRVQIACAISGRPLSTGTFRVNLTIKDNKGGTATSILNLTVSSPLPRFALPWTFRR